MKILKAWWHTQSCAGVYFDRDLDSVPEFFVETDGAVMGAKSRVSEPCEFAEYTSYYIKGDVVHFLLNSKNFYNVARHGRAEYYVCGNFNGWQDAIGNPEWRMKPLGGDFEYGLCVPLSLLGDRRRKFLFKFATSQKRWLHPRPDAPNIEYDGVGNANLRFFADRSYRHFVLSECEYPCDLREPAFLYCPETGQRVPIEAAELLLESNYNVKMGVEISGGATRFALFAPRADLVQLLLRDTPRGEPEAYPMSTEDGALWMEVFPGNLAGKFYSYKVYGRNITGSTAFDPSREIVDPYAEVMLDRGGPAMIVDKKASPRAAPGFVPPQWPDLLIMEAHVRDVLANAPASIDARERMGFRGLAKWLRSGDCYLEKSGANCIELQPVQEFDNASYADYHWGYMPVNWFSPASAYALEPEKFSQREDFADMVDAFHERGLALILDVVYNHCGEPNHLLGIDKEYYFETTADGGLTNFSGCGNDFRAGAPMSKKLVIESLKHFMKAYRVDGFRFDLAELLGADVMSEIEVELKKVNPSVILIAEPWSFRGNISQALSETGFAYWNDGFREFMLKYAQGDGNFDGFKYYISGSQNCYASWPAQTVNYVESHDDMCLLDRISKTPENPSVAEIRAYRMCIALTLASIGIPMLAEGADLLRTKRGVSNTYLRGDLNALDYARGEEYSGLRQWVRAFCGFRRSPLSAALRLGSNYGPGYVEFFPAKDSAGAAALFNADGSRRARRVFAAFNPSASRCHFALGNLDLGSYVQIADLSRFDLRGISDPAPLSHGVMELPPRSFALYVEKR